MNKHEKSAQKAGFFTTVKLALQRETRYVDTRNITRNTRPSIPRVRGWGRRPGEEGRIRSTGGIREPLEGRGPGEGPIGYFESEGRILHHHGERGSPHTDRVKEILESEFECYGKKQEFPEDILKYMDLAKERVKTMWAKPD